jgi:hypothetical protein
MKKVIRLTESDLIRIIKKTINEIDDDSYDYTEHGRSMDSKPKKLTYEDWKRIWMSLRKANGGKGFGWPDDKWSWFPYGGVDFTLDENGGYLYLPPQRLSDWRDDADKAMEVLDNYVTRIKAALDESEFNLNMDVSSDYSMKIYSY